MEKFNALSFMYLNVVVSSIIYMATPLKTRRTKHSSLADPVTPAKLELPIKQGHRAGLKSVITPGTSISVLHRTTRSENNNCFPGRP